MKDKLGDKVKCLESITDMVLDRHKPIMARVDGRAFHTFCRGLERPFDRRFADCMVNMAEHLLKETSAKVAFVQSDEVTLVWECEGNEEVWFGGRLCKMVSNLASQATLRFFVEVLNNIPSHSSKMPTFDARVWSVPSRADAVEALLWRQQDAIRNGINQLAFSHYSHKEIDGKSTTERLLLLGKAGFCWDKIDPHLTRGTFLRAVKKEGKFTAKEIESLPMFHNARFNPNLSVWRTVVTRNTAITLDRMGNPESFVFDGETEEGSLL